MQQLRDSMSASSDPRALRTREAIIAAMYELSAAGDTPLSVSALVHTAKISRSAFYAQFASLDELAMVMLRTVLAEIRAADEALRASTEVSAEMATRMAFGRLVAHVAENRLLYRTVLDPPVSYGVYRETVAALEAQVRDVLPVVAPPQPHVDTAVAATYIASGTIAVLIRWLHRDPSDTQAQVTEALVALLPGWLGAPVSAGGGRRPSSRPR